MKKRGISPLIATVLIIGFTIVLAAVVIQWGGSLVEKLKGQSEGSLAKLTCAEKVNINIKDACDTGISVLLTLENKGDVDIGSFVIRVNGDKTNVKEIDESISPFGVKKISVPYPISIVPLS